MFTVWKLLLKMANNRKNKKNRTGASEKGHQLFHPIQHDDMGVRNAYWLKLQVLHDWKCTTAACRILWQFDPKAGLHTHVCTAVRQNAAFNFLVLWHRSCVFLSIWSQIFQTLHVVLFVRIPQYMTLHNEENWSWNHPVWRGFTCTLWHHGTSGLSLQ